MTEGDDGKKRRKLRTLAKLSIEPFRHPLDQRATDALKKVPGLDKLLAKILEVGLERIFYIDNVASATTRTSIARRSTARTRSC